MRLRTLSSLSVLAIAVIVIVAAVAVAADAPRRTKKSCADYLEVVKKNSAAVGMKPTIVAASWGKLPPEQFTCTVDPTRTMCKCKTDKKQHGMVVTDTGYEAFTLSFM